MSNSYLTPIMSLPIPVPGLDPGPDWANNINAALTIIDSHTHAPGSGVQITPSALNINADLTFNSFNGISFRSVRFTNQSGSLSDASDLGCLYENGGDLYYNNASGAAVQVTNGDSVAGSTGTITGLPSGTASASFQSGSGTFQFQQATSTGANIDVATVAIRYPGSYPSLSGNYIALQAPSALSTAYAFTLPATTPASAGAFLTSGTSGALSYTNVDNSTVEINSATLRVKASGITSNEIAASAVGTTQIENGAVTFAKLAAININNSISSGSYTTQSASYTTVTGLSFTLTTNGGRVQVSLMSDGSTRGVVSSTAGTCFLKILRDSTPLAIYPMSFNFQTPSSAYSVIDLGLTSGAHTYSVQVISDGSAIVSVLDTILVAYEF